MTTSVALAGTEAVLEVTDTGTGIGEGDQKLVFDKFFRGSNAAFSTIPGIGRGLAICRDIVHAHEGRIEVTSELGAGTTMRVVLPFLPAAHLKTTPGEPGSQLRNDPAATQ